MKQIKRNLFNTLISEGKAALNDYCGANIKRINHFITPTLVEDQPGMVIFIYNPMILHTIQLTK